MTFQERLRQLRLSRGWSQEELANQLSLSRQAVQKWESGASKPDMENLVTLSRLFGVSLDWLVTGETQAASSAPPASEAPRVKMPALEFEYRSSITVWGLPLVHVHYSRHWPCWARGIIAVGNVATGVLAFGGIAAGLVTLGGLSLGLLALGGLTVGLLLSVGGVALGTLALGGVALGYLAVGGCAIGVCAIGGSAVGTSAAFGAAASAPFAVGEAVKGAHTLPFSLPASGPEARAFWDAFEQAHPWFAQLFHWLMP